MARHTLLYICTPAGTNQQPLEFTTLSDILEYLQLEHGLDIARSSTNDTKKNKKKKKKRQNTPDYDDGNIDLWHCHACDTSSKPDHMDFNSPEEMWWHLQQRHPEALRVIRIHRV